MSNIQSLTSSIQLQITQLNIEHMSRSLNTPRLKTASLDTEYDFSEEESKFHAYFLIKGEEINGNAWGVPEESIPKNIQTFEGKPFLVTADEFVTTSPYTHRWMHPNIEHFTNYMPELVNGLDSKKLEDVLKFQEMWKVADIKTVLYDEEDDYWKAIIKPLPLYENHKFPPFCSPAIFKDFMFENDSKIMNWQGVHLAGLKEKPAYGSQATYEGSCNGSLGSCTKQFSTPHDIWNTALKLTQTKTAAVLSTDNTNVNVVPVEGNCNGEFSKYSKPCQEK